MGTKYFLAIEDTQQSIKKKYTELENISKRIAYTECSIWLHVRIILQFISIF